MVMKVLSGLEGKEPTRRGDYVREKDFYEYTKREFGDRFIRHSCVSCPRLENIFRDFLRMIKPKVVLELGTYRGTSTAVLAHYASEKVIAVDMVPRLEILEFWRATGVIQKIEYYIVENDEDKKDLVGHLDSDFDFAFIDDDHTFEGVSLSFGLAEKCGRVLFHDYFNDYLKIAGIGDWGEAEPGVKRFVDALPKDEVTIREPFAYWRRK